MAEPRCLRGSTLFLFPVRRVAGRTGSCRRLGSEEVQALSVVTWPLSAPGPGPSLGLPSGCVSSGGPPTPSRPYSRRPACRLRESVFPATCPAHRSALFLDLLVLTLPLAVVSAPRSGPGPWRPPSLPALLAAASCGLWRGWVSRLSFSRASGLEAGLTFLSWGPARALLSDGAVAGLLASRAGRGRDRAACRCAGWWECAPPACACGARSAPLTDAHPQPPAPAQACGAHAPTSPPARSSPTWWW